jgi:hypothetical protein
MGLSPSSPSAAGFYAFLEIGRIEPSDEKLPQAGMKIEPSKVPGGKAQEEGRFAPSAVWYSLMSNARLTTQDGLNFFLFPLNP